MSHHHMNESMEKNDDDYEGPIPFTSKMNQHKKQDNKSSAIFTQQRQS
jgi:hypothetical protein